MEMYRNQDAAGEVFFLSYARQFRDQTWFQIKYVMCTVGDVFSLRMT